jgi:hypothetical protein
MLLLLNISHNYLANYLPMIKGFKLYVTVFNRIEVLESCRPGS